MAQERKTQGHHLISGEHQVEAPMSLRCYDLLLDGRETSLSAPVDHVAKTLLSEFVGFKLCALIATAMRLTCKPQAHSRAAQGENGT